MKVGLLSKVYRDLPLESALDLAVSHGIEAVEFGVGGYGGTAHCDPVRVVEEKAYADRLLAELEVRGLELSALSVHGNPLHPVQAIASEHDRAFRIACAAAERLGVRTLTLFSGCPGDKSGGSCPNWVTSPWPPEFGELWRWQWEEVAIPFWRLAAEHAAAHGVRLAFELHPNMLVYNPETLLRLRAACGPLVGANLDPSHLLWQGIDVLSAVREIGAAGALFHVHAKDTFVDQMNIRRNGVLDPKPYTSVAERAWTFRTVGYGHGEEFWRAFISELRVSGYDGVISIEHEDMLASVEEGVSRAVELLRHCVLTEPPATPWWT